MARSRREQRQQNISQESYLQEEVVHPRETEGAPSSYVRYADDCNIYVRSRCSGERVMAGVKGFVEGKLNLSCSDADCLSNTR